MPGLNWLRTIVHFTELNREIDKDNQRRQLEIELRNKKFGYDASKNYDYKRIKVWALEILDLGSTTQDEKQAAHFWLSKCK